MFRLVWNSEPRTYVEYEFVQSFFVPFLQLLKFPQSLHLIARPIILIAPNRPLRKCNVHPHRIRASERNALWFPDCSAPFLCSGRAQHADVALERVRERDQPCPMPMHPPRIRRRIHPRRTPPPSQFVDCLVFPLDVLILIDKVPVLVLIRTEVGIELPPVRHGWTNIVM